MSPQQRRQGRGRGWWLSATAVAAVLVVLPVACTSGRSTGGSQQSAGTGQGQQQAQVPVSVRGDLVGLVLSGASLTREGGGVTLRATITNQHTESVAIGDLLGPNGLAVPSAPRYEASGLYLYDGAARKRYDVLRDGDACRCSRVPLGIDPGQALQVFATFRDPGQVGEVSAVVPHFVPLDGLRIQG
jgi:hypothetical protein